MQTRILSLAIASGMAIGMFALAPNVNAAAIGSQTTTPSNTTPQTTRPNNRVPLANDGSKNTIGCTMNFTLSGWSALYKTSSGKGTITCDNGETMNVRLSAKGGGLTAGAYKVDNGKGHFSGVTNIEQVLGTYVKGTAHAGATKSGHTAVLTKNNVNLTLTGSGSGWNIGVGITGFTIKRASVAKVNH